MQGSPLLESVTWTHQHGLLRPWRVFLTGIACFLRASVASYSAYSGMGRPPMFGDYEAQRHWMSLTYHLPAEEWYSHDLPYWGLDYPPLTAYVSFLCGAIAHWINPAWVQLGSSRGFEDTPSFLFMRSSVGLLDLLVYFPAVYCLTQGDTTYNAVMLGLVLAAYHCVTSQRFCFGAFLFCLALLFKQMALYFALPFFAYLVGSAWRRKDLRMVLRLGLVVVMTFMACFWPFLSSPALLAQVVHRIFPVARGLFEDKVANFWCTFNLVIKLREQLTTTQLVRLSAVLTFVACVPSLTGVFRSGDRGRFGHGLVASALAFFLFSFQVHEKTILLPFTVALVTPTVDPIALRIFGTTALFSLWPLLQRDGLLWQYALFCCMWMWMTGVLQSPRSSPALLVEKGLSLLMLAIFALEYFVTSPARLPELWVVANTSLSFSIFALLWVYHSWQACTFAGDAHQHSARLQKQKTK